MCHFFSFFYCHHHPSLPLFHRFDSFPLCFLVDYILFITADVNVTSESVNPNEVRAVKYVDKAELQAMFEDPSTSLSSSPEIHLVLNHESTSDPLIFLSFLLVR